ncbi:hypothetical protein D3C73_1616240 [compost metagenome]
MQIGMIGWTCKGMNVIGNRLVITTGSLDVNPVYSFELDVVQLPYVRKLPALHTQLLDDILKPWIFRMLIIVGSEHGN